MDNKMIRIHQNDHADISDTLFYNFIAKNYEWGLSGIELENIDSFLETMKKETVSGSYFKFRSHGGDRYYIETGSSFISVFHYGSNDFVIDIFSNSKEELERVYELVKEFMKGSVSVKVDRTTFHLGRGVESKVDSFLVEDFDQIKKEYYPDFSDVNEFVKQFMESEESIFILSGQSGTGKSKFFSYILKYLLQNPSLLKKSKEEEEYKSEKVINVGYLKDETILAMDPFWITLNERSFDIVILDDLDYYLEPRSNTTDVDSESKKDKFISQLLSYTDGIIKNKTKFLISTNKDITSIDEALLRDGRLFGIYSFSKLKSSEALYIWEQEGLPRSLFEELFEREEVLQATLSSKISEVKRNGGKEAKSFIKPESNMDILKKVKKKKVGFSV